MMNVGFVSLIGILFGILGAHAAAFIKKKYSLGLTGNSLVGVFSSALFGKIFIHLLQSLNVSIVQPSFSIQASIYLISFISGLLGTVLVKLILEKYNLG